MKRAGVCVAAIGRRAAVVVVLNFAALIVLLAAERDELLRRVVIDDRKEGLDVLHLEGDPILDDVVRGLRDEDRRGRPRMAEAEPRRNAASGALPLAPGADLLSRRVAFGVLRAGL